METTRGKRSVINLVPIIFFSFIFNSLTIPAPPASPRPVSTSVQLVLGGSGSVGGDGSGGGGGCFLVALVVRFLLLTKQAHA